MVHALDLGKEIFKRYDLSVRMVSHPKHTRYERRSVFANSYEHDEIGYVTEEPAVREKMAQKRLLKFQSIQK